MEGCLVSSAKQEIVYRFDLGKWLLVVLMLGGAIFANYYFSEQAVLYRVLGLLVVLALALVVAMQTAKGAAFWGLMKGANVERRRVVWPTRQERNQTTLIVLAFIFITGLLLWGLDSLFGWLASLIIG